MRIVERLNLVVAGVASGVMCGICAAISVCALGGMALPKLDPGFRRLASMDLFVTISLGVACAGLVAGLIGPRVLRVVVGLAMVGPLSLLFGIAGLLLGAPGGMLVRFAMIALGSHEAASEGLLSYAQHDILVGCEVGMVIGALSTIRLLIWPPQWMSWRHT